MKDQCQLIGPISIFFQFLLGLIILASLVLKRQYEVPKRPIHLWFLDISKQIIGALIIHFLNLAMSLKYKDLFDDDDPLGDNECNWYFINLFMDSTIGVLILYVNLVLLYRLVPHKIKSEETLLPHLNADTERPVHSEPFGRSLAIFLGAIVAMKLIIYLILLCFDSIIITFSEFLDLIGDSNLKVFIIMFLSPICLNLLQFLIVDNIIKLMRLRY